MHNTCKGSALPATFLKGGEFFLGTRGFLNENPPHFYKGGRFFLGSKVFYSSGSEAAIMFTDIALGGSPLPPVVTSMEFEY